MALSEQAKKNKFAYIAKYTKENYYRMLVKFRNDTDKDLIDFLNSQSSKSDTIKKALREYMKKVGH